MPSPIPHMRYHFYDTDSGGACIDYLIRTYYQNEISQGADAYAVMNDEIRYSQKEAEDEDILFLPFLSGASAPISNTTVRAAFLNIKRSTQRRHIARAVMEGICFNLRWMRDIHREKNGWNINFLRGIGGGINSEVFLQMLSDVLETPFTPVVNPRFAGNQGLAACIDAGLGGFTNYEMLEDAVKLGATYFPRPETAQRYKRMYEIYRSSYRALEPVYHSMNKMQSSDKLREIPHNYERSYENETGLS